MTSLEECLEAYKRYASTSPITAINIYTNLQNTIHVCESTCSWFRHGSIYICRASGNMHLCGATVCNKIIDTTENTVCSITGTAYPLDFRYENIGYEYTPHFKKDALNRGTPTPTASPSPEPSLQFPSFPERSMSADSMGSARIRVAKSSKMNDENTHKNFAHATSFVRQVLSSIVVEGNKTLDTLVDTEKIVNHALVLWNLILGTEHYRQNYFKYKLQQHCLIVIDRMRNSLYMGDIQVIPVDPAIKAFFPPIKKLPEKLNITPSSHTASGNLFTKFMNELYPQCSTGF